MALTFFVQNDAESTKAQDSGNRQKAARFKEVKELILMVLEELDSLPENPKSA